MAALRLASPALLHPPALSSNPRVASIPASILPARARTSLNFPASFVVVPRSSLSEDCSSSAATSGNADSVPEPSGKERFYGSTTRRAALVGLSAVIAAQCAGELDGGAAAAAAVAGDGKQRGLPIEQVKDLIARDISEGQYFVTGDLTASIFRDDCRFKDPTNDTSGLGRYLAAVSILFDPAYSKQELLSIAVTSDKSITATWRLGGYLKFPWQPRVEPFTGSTVYELDDDNLVALHNESWSISPITALVETFTPTFGPKQLQ
ncbi:hypothetical protein CLOM_g206 [Closterium sp. NIES-68]|nr:hypothetical protein CLOM_g206 [Closterium sp. NIES-68]GJP68037.1 hypothetical protein CLOP_g24792 [Closterium sp. NIES-67]